MKDPACRRQTASTSRSRDRSFEQEVAFLLEISYHKAAFLVVLDNKEAATYNGVMPTTLFKSDRSLAQKIVALVVCRIKSDAMHDDFMPTTQI